jgi:hypothetical protein
MNISVVPPDKALACGGKGCKRKFEIDEGKREWTSSSGKEGKEKEGPMVPEGYARIGFYFPAEPEELPVAEDTGESSEEEAPEPPEPVSAASEDDDDS